jgi:hypothetical protein
VRKVQELYLFQPHQHVHFSYCGVEACDAIGQAPLQGIEPALSLLHDITQNHMNEDQRIFYSEFNEIDPDKGVMINSLPLLIQATIPSFHLRILNGDGDVVQDDDTYVIWLVDHLLWQGHTCATLTEESRQVIRRITVGVKNNTLRAFAQISSTRSAFACTTSCYSNTALVARDRVNSTLFNKLWSGSESF